MIYNYSGFSKKGGIYRIKNLFNERFYIGSTKCFKNRWSAHSYSLRNGDHHSQFLQADYNKLFKEHGNDDFLIFEVIKVVEGKRNELENEEQKHLNEAFLNSGIRCYNMRRTATVNPGLFGPENGFYKKTHSDSLKQKLSELGKKKVGINNPNYGNRWSDEKKEVMRAKVAERVKDPVYRSKLSQGQKTRRITEEEQIAINEKKRQAMLKLYENEDFKRKMLEAASKSTRSCRAVNQLTKDGYCLTTFPSIAAAAKAVGIHQAGIGECCNGTQKTAGGFKWEYRKNEED